MEFSDFLAVTDSRQLLFIEQINSTHDFLMEQAGQNKLENGLAIYAGFQSNGLGRSGNSWLSMPNKNLLFSMYLEAKELKAMHLYLLNMIAVLALQKVVEEETHLDAKVKWPNDLMIEGKKVAGIKINNVWEGQNLKYAVLSLGLNLNQMEWRLNHVTSLKSEVGKSFSVTRMATLVQDELLNQLARISDPMSLEHDFNQMLYKRNECVNFVSENEKKQGILQKVSFPGDIYILVEQVQQRYTFNQIKLSYEESSNH